MVKFLSPTILNNKDNELKKSFLSDNLDARKKFFISVDLILALIVTLNNSSKCFDSNLTHLLLTLLFFVKVDSIGSELLIFSNCFSSE